VSGSAGGTPISTKDLGSSAGASLSERPSREQASASPTLQPLRPLSPWAAFTCKTISGVQLQWNVFDPGVGHDYVRRRIPIAIFVQPRVEAIAIIHFDLGELKFSIGRKPRESLV
jgi:hypothetical protein